MPVMPTPEGLGLAIESYNYLFGLAGIVSGGLFVYAILAAFN